MTGGGPALADVCLPAHSSRQGGRARWLVLALVLIVAALAWWLWPAADGETGPPITERVAQISLADPDSLFGQVISQDDLPPEGTRSLFDHLMAQADGLPYPFEALLDALARQHPQGERPLTVMVPLGRSLLKGQADFLAPRVLATTDFSAPHTPASFGLAARGQLFLGLTEDAREIEVISYNEAAGRYEFQLVQDYCADCVPKIVYAQRAVCVTCHQGATPIFPQRPWSETNAHPAIHRRILDARDGDASYQGAQVVVPLAAPERYDEMTDIGAFVPAAQRAWLDGCGDGSDGGEGRTCRREMLRVALDVLVAPGGFDAGGERARRLIALQRAAWPADGIPVPESDIRNRDPLAEIGGVWQQLRQRLFGGERERGAASNVDIESFERLPPLPREFDPLTPRPPKQLWRADGIDAAYALAQFFTRHDLELLESASGYRTEALDAALDALPDDFFDPAPFRRVATLNALLQALGEPARDYCCLDTSEMSEPLLGGEPPLALADDSPLVPYQRYCFACHRGNPAARLNFMTGDSEEDVLARIRDTDNMRDVLDWDRYRGTRRESMLMPPVDSVQYRQMQAARERGEPVLADMREVVPSMFDF